MQFSRDGILMAVLFSTGFTMPGLHGFLSLRCRKTCILSEMFVWSDRIQI